MEKKDCLICKGKGNLHFTPFQTREGKLIGEYKARCESCRGIGYFEPLDEVYIRSKIFSTKGKNNRKLRASMLSPIPAEGHESERAYYVWKAARFHGGADFSLPMLAAFLVRGDSYLTEINELADRIAIEVYGSKYAGALRWVKGL